VRCYWEHVGNFGTCYEPIENTLGTIKTHSPHLLSSLGQNPQKSCNSQKISKAPGQRTGGSQKDRLRTELTGWWLERMVTDVIIFFPIFWQPWIIFEHPRLPQTKVFYFSFFVVSRIWRIFREKIRKIVQFALGRKFPENL
jgi:hypothetical protein